jgi:hypothetical protein
VADSQPIRAVFRSRPKQKSGEDASASEPPTNKGQVGKAMELLLTIAFIHSDSDPAYYRLLSDSGDV